ncbi:MAG: zinc ribbon domain-containing protein [Clostridia bacterium]|nr:zinc ribbon domain-containing protein [Clostridia bacterium]
MVCNKCGAQNPDESKFCQACGNALEAQTEQAAQTEQTAQTEQASQTSQAAPAAKGKKSNKMLIAIVAAVVVIGLLIGVIGVIAIANSGPDSYIKGDYSVIYDEESDESAVIYAGKIIAEKIEGKISLRESLDGTVAVYKDSDDSLYSITKSGTKKIVDEAASFELSDNGAKLVYTDVDGTSFLYDMKKGDKKSITDEKAQQWVFSPNGDALAYHVLNVPEDETEAEDEITEDEDEPRVLTYVFYKGKSTKVGEDSVVLALSDDCKYIYYGKVDFDENGYEESVALYVTNLKGEKTKISATANDAPVFNADRTQMLFNDESGKWYVSVKGGEKIKIDGVSSSVSSLFVIDGVKQTEKFQNNYFVGYSDGEYAIYKVNKKWSAEKLASGIDSYKTSDDGKTIYYIKSNKLYILGNDEAIEEDVKGFSLTSDGKAAYFRTEDDTLYYKKGKKAKKRIADDVKTAYITHDDTVLFLDEDGALFSSVNGKAPKSVGTDIENVYIRHDYTYFIGDYDAGEGNVYLAKSKAKFQKIISNITLSK